MRVPLPVPTQCPPRAGLAVLALAALLAGCATRTPGGLPVDARFAARAQDSRVTHLVLHYTGEALPLSLRVLTQDEVSAHYLVGDEDPPRIYRLVPEERRAWHAGVSAWRGARQLNASSIGIEIVNPGFRLGPEGRVWAPFPDAQVDAVVALVRDVVQRHGIRPENVVGHSDIAPQRKQDPGPAFPWARLAAHGLVPWPDAAQVSARRPAFEARLPGAGWFRQRLAQHGFDLGAGDEFDDAARAALSAFQMKYRPARHDGEPDAETAALLDVLVDSAGAAGR